LSGDDMTHDEKSSNQAAHRSKNLCFGHNVIAIFEALLE